MLWDEFKKIDSISVGVVAVIRADNADDAFKMSEACVKGGRTYEYRSHLYHSISRRGDSAVIGAGTVLDPVTARIALLAGAEFVVSPSFEEETAKLCNLYGIPYMPGVQTLGEIKEAMKFGPMY